MGFLNLNAKYRSLILSIVVLLFLIFAFLLVTIFATQRLANDSKIVDASHQIAINTQSVLKDLFDLESSQSEDISSPHMKAVITRIRGTIQYNNDLLDALHTGKNGNHAEHQHGENYEELPAVTGEARAKLEVLDEQWRALEPVLQDYLKDVDDITVDSSKKLYLASSKAATSSILMEESLNDLLGHLHTQNNRTQQIITITQIVGIAVLFIYFAIFLSVFLRRLQKIDSDLEVARQETEEIMATVNTGLFLLDKDLKIGNQYSRALENIIGTNQLAGERLSSILRNRVSDKDLKTAEEFVEQLYKPHVKEKLVHSLNPLHKIMIQDGQGASEGRYLDFTFSRVYEGSDIARILVNVNDVSEAVRLEQRLEQERTQNDRQIEMLTTILNVSPRVINDFIENTYTHIEKMNNTLKNPGSSQFELETKLKSIYREMHSLKGEASALKLHSFTKIASDAEDKLHALQNQGKLSGNDFLPLTVQLDELLSLSNTIKELGGRINASQLMLGDLESAEEQYVSHATREEMEVLEEAVEEVSSIDAKEELGDYLVQFGQSIAERQKKQIEVDVSRMAGTYIPKRLSVAVKEVCVQLLRNAIVHGIADSETRVKNGKNPVGRVSLCFQTNAGENKDHFMFAVEDDGQGIDYDAIRQRLISGGKYTEEQVEQLTKAQLLNSIFSSGFSTKVATDEDGGRGVGLDIVKDRVKEYGGKINVQSEKGQFSRFIVKLPMV